MNLCDDVFVHLLTFCEPQTLLDVRRVSQRANAVVDCHDRVLWKAMCLQLWKDKKGFSSEEFDLKWIPRVQWKNLYFSSLRESKRSWLCPKELEQLKWVILFKTDANQARMPVRFVSRKDSFGGEVIIKGQAQPFPFQLINDGTSLHVHVFPSHQVSRDKEWGWQISNFFVSFESSQVDFPHPMLRFAGYPLRPP